MSEKAEGEEPEDWKTFDKAGGCALDGALGCLPAVVVLVIPAFLWVSG